MTRGRHEAEAGVTHEGAQTVSVMATTGAFASWFIQQRPTDSPAHGSYKETELYSSLAVCLSVSQTRGSRCSDLHLRRLKK